MNNKNRILLGCLALLLVMSIGYALFSDTITINGTATAKGEFSLTTTCDMDKEALEVLGMVDRGSVTDAKITCEGNVVNASATLNYPGTQKWFRIMVENTGSIPAKLKKVVELNTGIIVDKDNTSDIYITSGDANNVVAVVLYTDQSYFVDYEGEAWGSEAAIPAEQFEAVLDPGETAYFYINMDWGINSTIPGEPLTATLNVQMDWQQVTVE